MTSYKAHVSHEEGYDIQFHTDNYDIYKFIERAMQMCADLDDSRMKYVDNRPTIFRLRPEMIRKGHIQRSEVEWMESVFCKFTLTPYKGDVWIDINRIEGIVEYDTHTLIATYHNKYDVKEKAIDVLDKIVKANEVK